MNCAGSAMRYKLEIDSPAGPKPLGSIEVTQNDVSRMELPLDLDVLTLRMVDSPSGRVQDFARAHELPAVLQLSFFHARIVGESRAVHDFIGHLNSRSKAARLHSANLPAGVYLYMAPQKCEADGGVIFHVSRPKPERPAETKKAPESTQHIPPQQNMPAALSRVQNLRADVRKRLQDFVCSSDIQFSFPPMDDLSRYIIVEEIQEFSGLIDQEEGEMIDERRIVAYKRVGQPRETAVRLGLIVCEDSRSTETGEDTSVQTKLLPIGQQTSELTVVGNKKRDRRTVSEIIKVSSLVIGNYLS